MNQNTYTTIILHEIDDALKGTQAAQMLQIIDSLSERERDILFMTLGYGREQMSIEQIGQELTLTQARVQELLDRLLLKVRKHPDIYRKDVSQLHITALCKNNYDPWRCHFHPELTPGEIYKVTHIRMTSDFTYINLEDKEGSYNSVSFDFFLDGEPHNIYEDERCQSEALIRRDRALREQYEGRQDEKN